MKTYLTACLIALCAAVACTTEVPVTVEVEKPVTRVVPETVRVEVTREVDATREVHVTREVPVTRIVEATRRIEVTRNVPVTREVNVTREVPVTREVEVTRQVTVNREVPVTRVVVETVQVPVTRTVQVTLEVEVTREVVITRLQPAEPTTVTPPNPRELCADYPFIIALGNLQSEIYEAQATVAERATSGNSEIARNAANWFSNRLRTTRLNQFQVCGVQPVPFGWELREMQTFEGNAVCSETFDLVRDVFSLAPNWDNAPTEIREAWYDAMDGYVNYCDNDFLE